MDEKWERRWSRGDWEAKAVQNSEADLSRRVRGVEDMGVVVLYWWKRSWVAVFLNSFRVIYVRGAS